MPSSVPTRRETSWSRRSDSSICKPASEVAFGVGESTRDRPPVRSRMRGWQRTGIGGTAKRQNPHFGGVTPVKVFTAGDDLLDYPLLEHSRDRHHS